MLESSSVDIFRGMRRPRSNRSARVDIFVAIRTRYPFIGRVLVTILDQNKNSSPALSRRNGKRPEE